MIIVQGSSVGLIFSTSFYLTVTGTAVGGVVMPVNTFAIVGPWLAVIGLVGTVVVVAKKRQSLV